MSFLRTAGHRPFLLLLIVYLGLAVWYSVTIPLGEAPDEVPHITYVRYLAQHGRLPTTTEEHEAFQPPLYYALGAAVTFFIRDEEGAPFAVRANANYDLGDPRAPKNLLLHTPDEDWPYRGWALAWHLVRLLSIALGAVTVWAVYRLGLTLFPGRAGAGTGAGPCAPICALTMAAIAAFTPQFLFMSAVVNNDNAATALSALVLWQVAALLAVPSSGLTTRRFVVLGLVLGLGLLSKASLIAAFPVAALAVVVRAFADGRSPLVRTGVRAAGWLLVTGGLAAAVAGWYLVRNWRLFGDPLGWSFLLQINALREGPLDLEVLSWLSRGVFRSFWLGWIGIAFPDWVYIILGAVCLIGLAGFVAWLIRSWPGGAHGCAPEFGTGLRWTLVLLGIHGAITVGSLVRWTAVVLGTDQGRLIYPILPTVMLVLVAGWAAWVPRAWQARLLGGLATGMLALAVVTPPAVIAPVYAGAPAASEAELAAARPVGVSWDGVVLLGYRLESDRVRPGETLVLDLYWQATERPDRDLWSLIQFVDGEGKFLMYTDGSPTAGRDTTEHWVPGVPLASRHLLRIPDYGTPGEYRLTIKIHPFGEEAALPAVGPDGTGLDDQLVLPETVRLAAP